MNISITGRNFNVTDTIREYASGKISKFERKLSPDAEATVILIVDKYRHKVEVQLKWDSMLIQAESITEEMYASIDEVIEKLDRQISKYKEKHANKKRKDNSKESEMFEGASAIDESITLIERETYDMKPMTPEEAAMQIDLHQKNFYVFSNQKTGDTNVIYRKKDGNLGLIEPLK